MISVFLIPLSEHTKTGSPVFQCSNENAILFYIFFCCKLEEEIFDKNVENLPLLKTNDSSLLLILKYCVQCVSIL